VCNSGAMWLFNLDYGEYMREGRLGDEHVIQGQLGKYRVPSPCLSQGGQGSCANASYVQVSQSSYEPQAGSLVGDGIPPARPGA
jgi:hypothetical protein